ncbi:hypothetical protein QBC46DRAFT_403179 [Diplogelasinospora grovesii]|uniref:J domain-containing protein n=1 Tax=Diplogelasinospora grovesii TaxID=303347 RepID=A0AAN6NK64_9PEZI|nr:hypothetical protein QBC46DRAFT_403179 [Diplogelasinospora grovesii]
MSEADWENVDMALYTLSLYFRVLVLHWESSAATYFEVDADINVANVTWERVFADIQLLCPMEHHLAWQMDVRLESPHTHDQDGEAEGEAPGTRQPGDTVAAEEQPDPALIKKAYMKASLTHHPDKGGDTQTMAKVNEAYEVLKGPKLRRGLHRHFLGVHPLNIYAWMDILCTTAWNATCGTFLRHGLDSTSWVRDVVS